MTPTEALAALVAAVETLLAGDVVELAPVLAQAQAVLAQCQSCRHAPDDPACIYCSCCQKAPATDPIERLKAALKPAPPDRTSEALAERVYQALGREGNVNPLYEDHLRHIILRAIQETPR